MSNFSWLVDGSIVGLYLVITMMAGLMVRKYVGKVEHFLVAGREMNVFLGIASLAATEFGIVTCMYTAQAGYEYGFAGSTPGILQALAMFFIGLTGFCVKPLRDSGVMTIPELFEIRFGKFIRWLSGVVIVLGGLLNMGVFLRIGGEFLVLVSGMDERYLVITMTALLLMVAIYTILGGMLSVLVTDFLQFIVMSAGLLAVTYLILGRVGWSTIVDTVEKTHHAGGFNPFIHPKLGVEYVLAQAFVQIAATLTWQTTIARLLAAKDTWTGRKVYIGTSFFFVCRFLIPGIWGIAALAMLTVDQQAALAKNPDTATLHAMPVFLSTVVPIGLMGLLVAAMLAADMSTDSSYMITWAAVIYNDILGPFRKQKSSEAFGLLVNRMIVALIGVFLFFYGLFYKLEGGLWDYLTTTGTVYLSSMSVLLIACCYWKGANNWGAAASIVVGATFPIGYLVLEKTIAGGAASLKDSYGFTQDRAKIAAFVLSAVSMVVFSLLKPRPKTTVA
ncbi:sodium:solute symporter family protein [Schlesneria paludicola]|uniref:sodium:solute symporter family protein n=1 Tax=Schlesneria paludicola TaxID=360056 RepID=UPI00029B04A9|nr:sodium:solute symporter family protein [Schlesneria paludicola]